MALHDGFVDIIDRQEFENLLAEGRPLRIKAGFDPTAPDLHLGHAVLLKKLRQFQDKGHTVLMIVGNATAAIGDPTGRNQLRPPLSDVEIDKNAWTYMRQAFKILDKERTVLRKNAEWFDEMKMPDVIRLMSHFTLSQIGARDDFKERQKNFVPVYLHELLYPLMQAYDSHREGVDMELGGTDQFFNLMVGRDYMRMRGSQNPQVIATVPLLLGTDGVKKMSKSLGNHVGLTEPPFEMFGKIMSISDATMLSWYDVLMPDLKAFHRDCWDEIPPMEKKLTLAWHVTAWLHSADEASAAQSGWKRQFTDREKPEEMPVFVLDEQNRTMRLDRLLARAGLASSVSEAGRLIKGGGVNVNGVRVTEPRFDSLVDVEIRVGRKWLRVKGLEWSES